jgi:hypothetical protein
MANVRMARDVYNCLDLESLWLTGRADEMLTMIFLAIVLDQMPLQ